MLWPTDSNSYANVGERVTWHVFSLGIVALLVAGLLLSLQVLDRVSPETRPDAVSGEGLRAERGIEGVLPAVGTPPSVSAPADRLDPEPGAKPATENQGPGHTGVAHFTPAPVMAVHLPEQLAPGRRALSLANSSGVS